MYMNLIETIEDFSKGEKLFKMTFKTRDSRLTFETTQKSLPLRIDEEFFLEELLERYPADKVDKGEY